MRGIDLRDQNYQAYDHEKKRQLHQSVLTAFDLYNFLPQTTNADIDEIFQSKRIREIAIKYKAVSEDSMRIGKWLAAEVGLNPVDYADMDAVAADETAMNAVVESETVMNVIAASEIARDAIWNSSLAWDKVKVSNMAIGKYIAGAAGLNPVDYADMDAVAADETAMNAVVESETALNAIEASETALNIVVESETAMNVIAASETAMDFSWHSDTVRQKMWTSPIARLAIWNNIEILRAVTVTDGPNLISETELNVDADAGLLTKESKTEGSGDWTAVNIDDGNKYIAFIHFRSRLETDWYQGKIASYDQTTDLLTINGGSDISRGTVGKTSNGLWVWFHDNAPSNSSSSSYARVWYIKV